MGGETRPPGHARVAELACWSEPVDPRPVAGGITNENFLVEHRDERFFVRVGDDIAPHNIVRWHEVAASRAAHAAGISPAVRHHEPGALVLDFIEGNTYTEADVRGDLERIVLLLRRAHREIPLHFRGPALVFWVFQVLRGYASTLREGRSRHLEALPRLLGIAATLEREVGPVEIAFGHNDLLASNFIDDGERLWLVDWEYAGFNSPLFDLGGLASNNSFDEPLERALLELYLERSPDERLRRRYQAMKCASLLRESVWSMVSEIHSTLDVDYEAYTAENLERFEHAWETFGSSD